MVELTNRNPSEMDHDDLRAEWEEVCERLHSHSPSYDDELYWERRGELWDEMESRTDADPPECPECGGEEWGQSPGEPKVCGGCDLHLGMEHEALAEDVDSYWRQVKATPEPAEA